MNKNDIFIEWNTEQLRKISDTQNINESSVHYTEPKTLSRKIHYIQFHLYEVLEQAKLIYDERKIRNNGCPRMG